MDNNELGNDKKPAAEADGSPASNGEDGQRADSTSARKKESNQRNSRQSTGPTTEGGKRTVRRNALKHGFYATDAVIGEGDGWEHEEEFNSLLEALRRDCNPQGTMEESLVHSIAIADWRLRRACRSEVGEILRAAGSIVAGKFHDRVEHSALLNGAIFPQANPKEGARKTAALIEAQLELLSNVRGMVEQCGYIAADLQEALDKSFGTEASGFASTCYELSYNARRQQSPEERESSDPARERGLKLLHPEAFEGPSAEDCKNLLLRHIDIRMEVLRCVHKDIETMEQRDRLATLMAHNLPPKEFVDKLIPYESALERKKERAIKLLLELQERRSGQQK